MSFGLFDYHDSEMSALFARNGRSDEDMLRALRARFSDEDFPPYVVQYLEQEIANGNRRISFHRPSGFGTAASRYTNHEKNTIRRTKGIFATNEYRRSEIPDARHHLRVFHNGKGKVRLFYKINGGAVRFVQNRR